MGLDPKSYYEKGSTSFKRLNPHLLAPIPAKKPEPKDRSAGNDSGVAARTQSMGYAITIVQFRKRLLDSHDNMRFACKPLVDAITKQLGFTDDADKRLEWRYEQTQNKHLFGTLVKVEQFLEAIK
jgi:hypothetical protein